MALAIVAAGGVAHARPGGGSSFSSPSSSGSGWGGGSSSWSSGSHDSSWSFSSRPSHSSPRPSYPAPSHAPSYARPLIEERAVSYMVHVPQERRTASLRWRPGRLGPYGEGPARPASLPIGRRPVASSNWIESLEGAVELAGTVLGSLLLMGLPRLARVFYDVTGWTTAQPLPVASPPPSASVRKQLEAIRRVDPDFSVVLLEDFLYALYTEAQTARGQNATARLGPYLARNARIQLDALGAHPVSGVVVGSLGFRSFSAGPVLALAVEIEANYAEEYRGQTRGYQTREIWRLERKADARSRPPERIRVFDCPACGSPLDRLLGGTCQYCNRVVDGGAFDWTVTAIEVDERVQRGPMLTGSVAESGTDLPTRFDPALAEALAALRARDPAFDETGFRARVEHIFQVMQEAWSTLRWEAARPYLSDHLFEAQSYWIEAYRAQGLRNVTADARVTGVELVRLGQDRWFDAITVRLHAAGHDFTIRDSDGQVVAGSKNEERWYTEYWTLIRGATRTGAARAEATCPSCGAPLEVSMAVRCKHCDAKVNSGAFDWVLSRIEQDEVYAG